MTSADPQAYWAFVGSTLGWLLLLALVSVFLVRLSLSFRRKLWRRQDHTWYSRASCAAGLHWHGSSGNSCLHNITVCRHCGDDVLWVVKDEAP